MYKFRAQDDSDLMYMFLNEFNIANILRDCLYEIQPRMVYMDVHLKEEEWLTIMLG